MKWINVIHPFLKQGVAPDIRWNMEPRATTAYATKVYKQVNALQLR